MKKNPELNRYISNAGKARRRKKMFIFSLLGIAGFFGIFIFVGLLFFKGNLLQAEAIEITGFKNTTDDQVRSALESQVLGDGFWSNLLGFQNILIWPDSIDHPERFLPAVKSIDIERSIFDKKIFARVTERSAYGIWCEGDETECFWFDDGGYIFKKGLLSEGTLIKAVRDNSGRKLGLGTNVLPPEAFENLKSVFTALTESGVGFSTVELKDLSLGEAWIKSAEGPEIYMSLRFSSVNSLPLLKTLKDQGGLSKLQYVDLRIPNRVYYK